MAWVEESSAYVFMVGYTVDGREWVVRVKQVSSGDKERLEVVNADSLGESLTGTDWDHLVTKAGVSEDFWAKVVHQFLLLVGGGLVEA